MAYSGTPFLPNCMSNSVKGNWMHNHTDMEITNLISLQIRKVTNETKFYISLTVHLGIILVNNQLDALFQCTRIYLFHFSTCFEQPSAHHQENQLYQYIIWYISLFVGDWPAYQAVTYKAWYIPDDVLINWFSWWWALGCSKHVEMWNK